MFVATPLRPARKRGLLRSRIAGAGIVASAIFMTSISFGLPVQAAASVWDGVAACESSGNWAINSGNGFFGGLQFTSSTWISFGGGRYAPSADKASRSVQIAIARRVLVAQGPGAWPVCSVRAGLNRVNGAAAAGSDASRAAPTPTVSRSRTRIAIASHAKLSINGRMNPRTVAAMQRWVGTTSNGVFRTRTVKALQRKVGAQPDGLIGRRTVHATQVTVGARRDGSRHLTAATVSALQTYLNAR